LIYLKSTVRSARDFGQLWILIANISGTDRDIDKRKRRYQLQYVGVRRKNLTNFGPLTTKFSCLISTHPRSPLRVLCIG